jgi:hypothetical protein
LCNQVTHQVTFPLLVTEIWNVSPFKKTFNRLRGELYPHPKFQFVFNMCSCV